MPGDGVGPDVKDLVPSGEGGYGVGACVVVPAASVCSRKVTQAPTTIT